MDNTTIPVWDLESVFTDFNSERYTGMFENFGKNISRLETLAGKNPPEDTVDLTGKLTEIIRIYNETGSFYEELVSYAYCRYSTDTSDAEALNEFNRIEAEAVGFSTAIVKLRNYFAEAGSRLFVAVDSDDYLKQFRFFFEEQLLYKEKQMNPEMEKLAADLARSGSSAWERLQQTLSSSTTILWDEDSGERKTSVELRAMAGDPDEKIRRRAWEKELELWKTIETPMAFALNGVKGASIEVNSRRDFRTTLERSAMQSRISMSTLEALINVMTGAQPLFRRYMKLKAGLLGKQKLAFYDLFAPAGKSSHKYSYTEAADFIVEQFSGFSSELGNFARTAFDRSWIDAKPRQNKVGGAYCTGMHVSGESRILCNFDGTFQAVSTIAHELGHAYHNFVLKDAHEIYRDFPMTLAETASIFCETIILENALKNASADEQLALIEHELMESTQIIVDILSRFIFEKNVFDKRREQELTAGDFCSMMLEAQKQTYGDAMDQEAMHPYMWAVKGHYYHQELGFYNFPYAFGKLFGLGLYSRYREEGPSFTEKYKEILYMTGNATAEDVTKSAGCDITTEEFWRSSIELISEKVDIFEKLCADRK